MQAKSAPTAVPKRNTRAFVSKYKSAIIVMIGSFILAVILAAKAGPSSLFNTLVTGGMWALLAVGLSLVFGVMNVAHFAHGESFMVGAFIGYFVFTPISKYLKRSPNEFLSLIAPFLGIIVAALVGLVVGYLLERLLFRPLRGRGKSGWVMNTFLVTVGLSFVMINGTTLLLGPNFRGVPRYWNIPPIEMFGIRIAVERLVAFGLAMLTIFALWLFLQKTRTGRAIRAVSQDETGAQLVGINLNNIYSLTFALCDRDRRDGRRVFVVHVSGLPHGGPQAPLLRLVRGDAGGAREYRRRHYRRLHRGIVADGHPAVLRHQLGRRDSDVHHGARADRRAFGHLRFRGQGRPGTVTATSGE